MHKKYTRTSREVICIIISSHTIFYELDCDLFVNSDSFSYRFPAHWSLTFNSPTSSDQNNSSRKINYQESVDLLTFVLRTIRAEAVTNWIDDETFFDDFNKVCFRFQTQRHQNIVKWNRTHVKLARQHQ